MAGVILPSVVQYKYHLHQSVASPLQSELLAYCLKEHIIFNGIAPLGGKLHAHCRSRLNFQISNKKFKCSA